MQFPSPTSPRSSRAEVFLGYLEFFRARVIEKIAALEEKDRRSSCIPSRWTPLSLAKHLAFVERRWLEWGFEGRDVADVWGDHRDGRWYVGDDESSEQVLLTLADQGRVTRSIVTSHALDDVGEPGPRWEGAEPATLERVLFHLVQEYSRHLGQLDVVTELRGGPTGE